MGSNPTLSARTLPKSSKPIAAPAAVKTIELRRDGKPDLRIEQGRHILTVETEPVQARFLEDGRRWRVYRLYENAPGSVAVVAEEGHSTYANETVRYNAIVCKDGVDVWEAMGKMDELKPVLAELGWPAVETI